MKVLVLGGYGAVGPRVVAELRAHGDIAFTAGPGRLTGGSGLRKE